MIILSIRIRGGRLQVDRLRRWRLDLPLLIRRKLTANALKIVHAIRANVRTASLCPEVRRIPTTRAATLESDGDEPRNTVVPSGFSRSCRTETSGKACVFSPNTLGLFKRQRPPNLHHATRVVRINSNPVDFVLLSTEHLSQMRKQEKGSE